MKLHICICTISVHGNIPFTLYGEIMNFRTWEDADVVKLLACLPCHLPRARRHLSRSCPACQEKALEILMWFVCMLA